MRKIFEIQVSLQGNFLRGNYILPAYGLPEKTLPTYGLKIGTLTT